MIYVARIVQGLITVLLSMGVLLCVKKTDSEHQLPIKHTWMSAGAFFMGGFLLLPADIGTSGLLIIFISYLAAMAYTDFHSGQVYPFFYLIVAFIGYVQLAVLRNWMSIFQVFMFGILVFLGQWIQP